MRSAHVIEVNGVNEALREALGWLLAEGYEETSRNGPVLRAPGPVIVTYLRPWERVLFSRARDANPFFHLMEALWMLAGRNDLAWVQQFNRRMAEFSDDGEVLHGAYGFRWREWFGFDQLEHAVRNLREQPATRRVVVQMWSPGGDTVSSEGAGGFGMKDLPCNLSVLFARDRWGRLEMTVFNRSNDALWGAFGANAVHMSYLHEYVALALGWDMGAYHQVSNNLHVYTERASRDALQAITLERDDTDYRLGGVRPLPILAPGETIDDFDADLRRFMDNWRDDALRTRFFRGTARPAADAWFTRQRGLGAGLHETFDIGAEDWRWACTAWIQRRENARLGAAA